MTLARAQCCTNENSFRDAQMNDPVVHILSLCVGITHVDQLVRHATDLNRPPPARRTRNRPRRTEDLLNGGSLYWIIGGFIQARQRILRIDECREPNRDKRWAIMLDRTVVHTVPVARNAFRGWRYFEQKDVPADHEFSCQENGMTQELDLNLQLLGFR